MDTDLGRPGGYICGLRVVEQSSFNLVCLHYDEDPLLYYDYPLVHYDEDPVVYYDYPLVHYDEDPVVYYDEDPVVY